MQIIWVIIRTFIYYTLCIVICTALGAFAGGLFASFSSMEDASKIGAIVGIPGGFALGLIIGSFVLSSAR
jgi:ABC-type uncharacterized transport system permease subunit